MKKVPLAALLAMSLVPAACSPAEAGESEVAFAITTDPDGAEAVAERRDGTIRAAVPR